MVTTDLYQIVVCDAGPLIHLDELSCLELLNDFAEVIVPDTVWQEVEQHRPRALYQTKLILHRRNCALPNAEINALATLFTLHRGEKEALRLACEIGNTLLLTDDTAARLAARSLGITVHGSIGILVRAIRCRQKTKAEVIQLLGDLPEKTTLFIRPSLLADIIQEIEAAP
ncbi:MAG: DNA-binding protein [Candidatus Competibacteraceae bacterium]